MRILATLLYSLVIIIALNGQSASAFIQKNAIEIKVLDELPQALYDTLKQKALIMVGEMHGTTEPANFVLGLTRLFNKNGRTVQLGVEIPRDQMLVFLNAQMDSNLIKARFFQSKNIDGRLLLNINIMLL